MTNLIELLKLLKKPESRLTFKFLVKHIGLKNINDLKVMDGIWGSRKATRFTITKDNVEARFGTCWSAESPDELFLIFYDRETEFFENGDKKEYLGVLRGRRIKPEAYEIDRKNVQEIINRGFQKASKKSTNS